MLSPTPRHSLRLSQEIINKNDSCVGGGRGIQTEHQEMDKVFAEACGETRVKTTVQCIQKLITRIGNVTKS